MRVRLGGLLAAHVYGAIGRIVAVHPGRVDVEYPHNTTGEIRIVQVYPGEYQPVREDGKAATVALCAVAVAMWAALVIGMVHRSHTVVVILQPHPRTHYEVREVGDDGDDHPVLRQWTVAR